MLPCSRMMPVATRLNDRPFGWFDCALRPVSGEKRLAHSHLSTIEKPTTTRDAESD
jgi:hypothetical protein